MRVFLVKKYKTPLYIIDRPRQEHVTALVAHPSEKGWRLHREHERHLLRIPPGMLGIRVLLIITDF